MNYTTTISLCDNWRFISPVQFDQTISVGYSGGLIILNMKSGATQGAAGAAADELWKTASHATLPDNVVMIGV